MMLATNDEVRLLELDGRVSQEVYKVADAKQARKGHLQVHPLSNPDSHVKVATRRVLPRDADKRAPVTHDGDHWFSHCPTCGSLQEIDASSTDHTCETHGNFQLLFLGERPMATTATKKTAKKSKPKVTKEKKPVQSPKAPKEVELVDFDRLKSLEGCELWTKKNVKFDHPSVNVASHVLLFVGDDPRKLCFNTYNGGLGKKNKRLPIDEFLADEEVQGGGKRAKPWFPVREELDKVRAKLAKDNYEQE